MPMPLCQILLWEGELSFVFTSTVWPMCISLFNYNFFTSGTAFSLAVSVYFVPSSPFYGNVLHRFLLLAFTCLSRFELNFFLMREVLISQNILLRARLCKILFHHPTTTTTTTFLSNMFRSVVHFQDSLCSWVAVVHTGSFAGLKASIVKEVGSV